MAAGKIAKQILGIGSPSSSAAATYTVSGGAPLISIGTSGVYTGTNTNVTISSWPGASMSPGKKPSQIQEARVVIQPDAPPIFIYFDKASGETIFEHNGVSLKLPMQILDEIIAHVEQVRALDALKKDR